MISKLQRKSLIILNLMMKWQRTSLTLKSSCVLLPSPLMMMPLILREMTSMATQDFTAGSCFKKEIERSKRLSSSSLPQAASTLLMMLHTTQLRQSSITVTSGSTLTHLVPSMKSTLSSRMIRLVNGSTLWSSNRKKRRMRVREKTTTKKKRRQTKMMELKKKRMFWTCLLLGHPSSLWTRTSS